MLTIRTNIPIVTASLVKKLQLIGEKEFLLRPVAFDIITLMTERIHREGKASDESPIGDYSNSYLKLRKSKYNRSVDKKIIVSLTRQLENDWSVIATEKGYGIGFLNSFNFQKASWVEANKSKVIFKLSDKEKQHVATRLNELIADALDS